MVTVSGKSVAGTSVSPQRLPLVVPAATVGSFTVLAVANSTTTVADKSAAVELLHSGRNWQ
ncbi:hypothetical protein [Adhaeribacter aquaticus]|uniref:hypothetical protein n=1 Tax=Adhaeribacter aquaticus TaxID=299567 RepID=UPI0012FAC5E9|nr:hypothetical protein [Adhaeribacter aquaticus]